MKKALLSAVLIVVVAMAVYHYRSNRLASMEQVKRETSYKKQLAEYSQMLKPGMTRQEVDDILRQQHISFMTRSGDDLIQLAHEPYPHWYCDYELVSVGIYYESSDRVRAVDIDRWPQECM